MISKCRWSTKRLYQFGNSLKSFGRGVYANPGACHLRAFVTAEAPNRWERGLLRLCGFMIGRD
jgi:hypothetical protein